MTPLCRPRYSVVDMPEEGISQSLPVDLYYSGLDGDWDANENNKFGELLEEDGQTVDEADMGWDVIVRPHSGAQCAGGYKLCEQAESV